MDGSIHKLLIWRYCRHGWARLDSSASSVFVVESTVSVVETVSIVAALVGVGRKREQVLAIHKASSRMSTKEIRRRKAANNGAANGVDGSTIWW